MLAGDPMFAGFDTTGERVPLGKVGSLLAPVIPRSKVVAVGKNYREHAAEMGGDAPGEPLLFLKPNTAVIGLGDAIIVPPQSKQVDFEGELAVVIGKIAKNVEAEDAARPHLRLHGRQRRDRTRPAEDGRPVDPRQGLRHLLPARAGHRDRAEAGRRTCAPGSTAS